ncbi:hypothetical protein ACN28I_10535 [Archangium gephyra]|uniref:hypothetical protein n=1 Tax=Archangium gephyra TaxID=48 RepID=UPI003B7EC93A
MHALLRLALALFLLAAPVALAQTKDPEGPPRCLTVPMEDGISTHPKAKQTGLVVVEGYVAAFGASCVNTYRLEARYVCPSPLELRYRWRHVQWLHLVQRG